jgi:hypothetical protein
MNIDWNYVIGFFLHSHDQTLSFIHQHLVYIFFFHCIISQTIKKYQTLGHFCESLYMNTLYSE